MNFRTVEINCTLPVDVKLTINTISRIKEGDFPNVTIYFLIRIITHAEAVVVSRSA